MDAIDHPPPLGKGHVSWLLAIVVGAAVLILPGLGDASLIGDEITVATIGPESIPEILRLTFVDIIDPAYGRNRPLFNLLVHASMKVVDDLETATRLPSAIAGLLGVLAMFRLGRKLASVRTGLVAAALFGAAHGQVWASRSATAYAWMVLCVILALTAALDALRAGRARDWARLGAWCALGYYFHPVMAFASLGILPGALLVVWTPQRWSARRVTTTRKGQTLACLGTGALLMLPAFWCIGWLLWWSYGSPPEAAPYDPHFMSTGRPKISFEHEQYRLVREIVSFVGTGTAVGFVVVAGLALIGLGLTFASGARGFAWLALATFAIPTGMLLTVPFAHGFGARYLIFWLPLSIVLAARGLTGAVDGIGRGARWSPALLIGATLALAASNAPHWYARDPRVPMRDWSAIAAALERTTQGRTIVLVGSAGTPYPTPDPAGRRELGLYLDEPDRFTTCTPGARATDVWREARDDLRERDELVALALDGEQLEFEPWRADPHLDVEPVPGGWLFSFDDRSLPVFERQARLLVALAHSGTCLADAGAMFNAAFDAMVTRSEACPVPELFDVITAWEAQLDPLEAVPFRAAFAQRFIGIDERLRDCPPDVRQRVLRYPRRRRTALANASARAALMAKEAGDLPQAVDLALRAMHYERYDRNLLTTLEEACREAGLTAEIERLEAAWSRARGERAESE